MTASPERQRTLTAVGTTPLSSTTLFPSSAQANNLYSAHSNGRQNGVASSMSPTTPPTPRLPYVNGIFQPGGSGPRTPTQQSVSFQQQPSHTSSQPRTASVSNLPSQSGPHAHSVLSKDHKKQPFYPSASTTLSAPNSTGSTTLTYHLITTNLALLALIPTGVYEERRGLLEYNVVFFREGVQEICDVEEEARSGGG